MKHFLKISILTLLFTASPLLSQATDTQKQTTLIINVTNSTANGTATVNDEVLVNIFEQRKLIQTLNGSVDSQGKAVFENVPTGNNITALPRVKHQDMMFNGHPVALTSGQTVFNSHVEVYEV